MPGLKDTMRGLMFNHLPMIITCREFEDFILAYLDGELPKKQRFVFDLHLKVCRECRDYLAAYKQASEVSKRAYDASPEAAVPDTVPEDLIKAVLVARKERAND